ncbi:MAG TPA: hypothetical protein VE991_01610 [Acidimicrobiales bacterium]|nr:hypothetical protein [Acidimicrobiales bacterium]
MTDHRWVQIGGLAGLVYVIANVVAESIVGSMPNQNASVATITSFVNAHRHALVVSSIILVASFALVLWFLGTVHHALRRNDDSHDSLTSVVVASGVSAAVLGALSGGPMAVLAMMAGQPGGLSGSTVRALFDMQAVIGGLSFMLLFGFVFSLGVAFVHRGILGSWFLALTLVDAAIVALASGVSLAIGNNSAMITFTFVGLIGFGIVVICTSVAMISKTIEEPSMATLAGHAA